MLSELSRSPEDKHHFLLICDNVIRSYGGDILGLDYCEKSLFGGLWFLLLFFCYFLLAECWYLFNRVLSQ